MVDTTDEWIMTRIGIKERRILRDADKGSAYLGARAVEDLFRKKGLKPEEVLPLIEQIADFSHIQIKGLMTIPPYVDNAAENREIFRELKKLSVDIAAKNINNVTMSVLSMGMTGDYMVAVQEGATMVRVGTGIFGARNYAL